MAPTYLPRELFLQADLLEMMNEAEPWLEDLERQRLSLLAAMAGPPARDDWAHEPGPAPAPAVAATSADPGPPVRDRWAVEPRDTLDPEGPASPPAPAAAVSPGGAAADQIPAPSPFEAAGQFVGDRIEDARRVAGGLFSDDHGEAVSPETGLAYGQAIGPPAPGPPVVDLGGVVSAGVEALGGLAHDMWRRVGPQPEGRYSDPCAALLNEPGDTRPNAAGPFGVAGRVQAEMEKTADEQLAQLGQARDASREAFRQAGGGNEWLGALYLNPQLALAQPERFLQAAEGAAQAGLAELQAFGAPFEVAGASINAALDQRGRIPFPGQERGVGPGDLVANADLAYGLARLGYGAIKAGTRIAPSVAEAAQQGVRAVDFPKWFNIQPGQTRFASDADQFGPRLTPEYWPDLPQHDRNGDDAVKWVDLTKGVPIPGTNVRIFGQVGEHDAELLGRVAAQPDLPAVVEHLEVAYDELVDAARSARLIHRDSRFGGLATGPNFGAFLDRGRLAEWGIRPSRVYVNFHEIANEAVIDAAFQPGPVTAESVTSSLVETAMQVLAHEVAHVRVPGHPRELYELAGDILDLAAVHVIRTRLVDGLRGIVTEDALRSWGEHYAELYGRLRDKPPSGRRNRGRLNATDLDRERAGMHLHHDAGEGLADAGGLRGADTSAGIGRGDPGEGLPLGPGALPPARPDVGGAGSEVPARLLGAEVASPDAFGFGAQLGARAPGDRGPAGFGATLHPSEPDTDPLPRPLAVAGLDLLPPPRAVHGVELTPAEQRRFQAIVGRLIREAGAPLLEPTALDALDPEVRARLFGRLLARTREAVAAQLIAELEAARAVEQARRPR